MELLTENGAGVNFDSSSGELNSFYHKFMPVFLACFSKLVFYVGISLLFHFSQISTSLLYFYPGFFTRKLTLWSFLCVYHISRNHFASVILVIGLEESGRPNLWVLNH